MDIRMKQAESLYLESTMKSAEAREDKKADKTVSAASASGTEKVAKTVELDRTTGLTGVEKTGKAAEVRQASYDKFIPEKPEGSKSFGHYQPVSDGKGGIHIQFDAPAENTDKAEHGDVQTVDQTSPAKDGESVGETQLKQGRKNERKDKEAVKTGADGLTDGQTKVRKLKTKKKQLEQKIKNAVDPGEAEKLKRKLAQVKRELSTSGK